MARRAAAVKHEAMPIVQCGLFGSAEADLVQAFGDVFRSLSEIADVNERFRAAFRRVYGRPIAKLPRRTLAALYLIAAREQKNGRC